VASGITSAMTNQWTTAYGWGNHAGAGYLLPASTQTIAGASVSGTVALSSDSTNCLDLAGLRMMAGNINMGGRWSITNLFNLSGTGNVALVSGTALPTISAVSTYGNLQLGSNAGTMGISNGVSGAMQRGSSAGGIMSIGTISHGAEQAGLVQGRMVMSGAVGSKQLGQIDSGAAATNLGTGAIQLLDLSSGQSANTTTGGDGSLLLGAGTASNRYAIVAGDGQVSHGDGSITAGGGFWGSGANVTGVDAATLDGIDSTGFATQLQATNAAAAVMATGTVYNALNLDGVAANRYPTNLAVDVTDPWHAVSNVLTYTTSTVTLSRAMGEYVSLALTNNCTITFDISTYPTNGTAFLSLSLHPNGFSTTFDPSTISTNSATNTIPGSAGLAIQTNAWNLLLFGKSYGWTNFGVRQ